jgi:hypothetical protein
MAELTGDHGGEWRHDKQWTAVPPYLDPAQNPKQQIRDVNAAAAA